MLSRGLVILLSFTAIVAVVIGKPWSKSESEDWDLFDRRVDYKNKGAFAWLDDRRDGRHDIEQDRFQLFLYTIQSLEYKEDDYKSYNNVFKTFLKVLFLKKENYNGDFSLSKAFSSDHNDNSLWEKLFDNDEFSYKYDNDLKEEKTKKLFMYHLKFKAHYKAQKELERSRQNKEDKVRRQFSLFSELIDFCEDAKSHKETIEKFSKFVDLKLKVKFAGFKKCFFNDQCDRDDDKDLDVYREGEWKRYFSMDGSKDHYKDGGHFDLFLKLYKYVSETKDSYDFDDSFLDWDCDKDYDDHDWKKKESVVQLITYVNKHLSDHNPKGFWGKRDIDRDEDNEKFLFFSLKAYKELQEEKALKKKNEKLEIIYAHFLTFIKHQEDNRRSNDEFYKFKKWHQIKENKDRLKGFSEFLKKFAQHKVFNSRSDDYDVKGKYKSFYEYKKYDDSHDRSEDDSLEDLFRKLGDKKGRSRHDYDW